MGGKVDSHHAAKCWSGRYRTEANASPTTAAAASSAHPLRAWRRTIGTRVRGGSAAGTVSVSTEGGCGWVTGAGACTREGEVAGVRQCSSSSRNEAGTCTSRPSALRSSRNSSWTKWESDSAEKRGVVAYRYPVSASPKAWLDS